MSKQATGYHLVRRPAPPASAPRLDDAQQRVVSHVGGPLLVLAGPGTGKTTTITEAVADRVLRRGLDPGRMLVLTFSRKAAGELRERITARLDRTTRQPLALTFHSYAYALVRREFVLAGDEPPRLLSGPEHLVEVRRMLRGEAEDGGARWPERLRPALVTRGFAEELRDLLLRAAERGLDGRALARLGQRAGRDEWIAAGRFLDRYAGRFDLAPVPAYDYAEIVRIAARLLGRAATRGRERQAYDCVLVDEYQDTDPAQEAMLHALAGDGRELIVVGDPDQSIYAFRGADNRAIGRFADRFRTSDDRPADVIALGVCRRSGPVLLEASRRIAWRLPPAAGGVPLAHRRLAARPDAVPGEARIIVAESATQEAGVVADLLRRAHLVDGVAWSSMAVLVRSATRQVATLRRVLGAAGVPVAVDGDDLPLPTEPGVRPLITLLRCALLPSDLDEETAVELLTGPLGRTDALGLRRLRRSLRAIAEAADMRPDREPLASVLRDPRDLTLVARHIAGPAERVAKLLALARETAATGSAEDVLWAIWNASGLAGSLRAASAAGGTRGAAADRDLDAVVTLFHAAATFTDRLPPGAPRLFLDSLSGQEIAGDTLAQRAPHQDAVRILTAHRSKGLEWDVVVVAGVQEGSWPDLRLRGSVLGSGELSDPASDDGTRAAAVTAGLLAEERRLFYVAVSRARQRLIVTASGEESDERPSRFLAELAGNDIEIERVGGLGHRWLSLAALTAELRQAAADTSRPFPLRQAAAAQLAQLAEAGVRGAHPDQWYALTELSSPGPVAADGETLRLSPSAVESFTRCGLRWLIESAAGGASTSVLRHLGTVIHAAAVLAAAGATDAEISGRVDEIWHHLDFGSAWYGAKQRAQASRMIRKFLDWQESNPRELVAVEQALHLRIGRVQISGRVDRLERDADGHGVVVDLKTGASPVAEQELDRSPQLGVYQLAVLMGAFEKFGLTEPGGAELVQVGKAGLTGRARVQRQSSLGSDSDPGWAEQLVDTVAAGMAGPVFEAKVNPGCRTCPVAACCPVHPHGGGVTP
ncbi:MAG TPA: ATP-dependent DNA helicase [Streptosporangiaceae bacterium]|jgi:superfamily I DNA/RNA helicase/RecB family exonuclease